MITYDYYRIFYYVALFKSFSKAAEALHSNQPNITRSITRLETELGCKLFIRSNRGVTLTPEAKALFKHVAIACEQLDLGEEVITKMQGLKTGFVSIGASETALRLFLLERIIKFHKKYPGVHLKIRNSQTPDTIQALENGEVEIAVISAPFKIGKEYHDETIYRFEEFLIASPEQKEAIKNIHSVEDLAGAPLISLPRNSSSYEFYLHYFMRHGIKYRPNIETETADQVLSLVEHNFGFGFFPASAAQEYIDAGKIVKVPLHVPPIMRETHLVYHPKRAKGLAAAKAIEFIAKK
ncbi:MAG: LysR family transcriptional regulator [Acidaminococcus sp.]|jgi:DNA-binding transcriptional LysR family regulator|nr:LysR family transcriptional regulator [Acidaminococcus sp.]MCI2099773.1 LysR family transcriptional regulator [Acidaminococcus sp.]MCI2113957.1 LysR family transcriptional regulator [Acidaminococcus sp.]MCI2117086.1 LysR family transcriptional regulator [Acidaminococcus sp.]